MGQTNQYLELLEIAKQQAGLILYSKPSQIRFAWRMVRYNEEQKIKSIMSDSLINELIAATKITDYFAPIEDEKNVNKRRRTVGLGTIEDRAKEFGFEYKAKED